MVRPRARWMAADTSRRPGSLPPESRTASGEEKAPERLEEGGFEAWTFAGGRSAVRRGSGPLASAGEGARADLVGVRPRGASPRPQNLQDIHPRGGGRGRARGRFRRRRAGERTGL